MRLEEAKKKYAGQWIAFRAKRRGRNPDGEVVLHHRDRQVFDRELLKKGMTGIYITFAGPAIPEGYATLLPAASIAGI